MKIFLDTANMEEIIKYNKMGLLDGITTNPTLLSKETGMNPQEVMKDIAKLIKGDVSLEVIGLKSDEMIQEGKKLREYGENVVVKCPMTGEGLRACAELAGNSSKHYTCFFSKPSTFSCKGWSKICQSIHRTT